MEISKKRDLMRILGRVVKKTGEEILNCKNFEIVDIRDYKGHEESSIDIVARQAMQDALDQEIPELEGTIRYEHLPYKKNLLEFQVSPKHFYTLIIDEIDGTTNTKRALSSNFEYFPQAAVCIGLSVSEKLSDFQIGVVYTLDTKEIFSAFKVENGVFLAFRNDKLIYPEDVWKARGDTKFRVLVIGYSNKERIKKAEIEQALWDAGFRVYEGCRASTMDIIGLIRNQNDAYVDPRALWPESGAQLQTYDIAAVIPIALGSGLAVSDIHGRNWEDYKQEDIIPLMVARPEIHQKIIETLRPTIERQISTSEVKVS